MSSQDTIFAPATGAGRAAVTIVRLSGNRAEPILATLCRPPLPRRAAVRNLRGPDGEVLDRALVFRFPGPHSYTGEDCVELHLHGGRAVLSAVAGTLAALGARPAEPGEFSRRAFVNGRMDLLQAEAIADLVEADTEAQRRQALRQMGGALGAVYRAWADRMLALLARQEALIDFPEDDLPTDILLHDMAEISALQCAVSAHLDDGRRGERLREGLVFAVVGEVNAGKSTLVNVLAKREVAIVSRHPGTTRDVLEVLIDLGGVPVTLLDTAGLRETSDEVEAEGVRRARARMANADAILRVTAAGASLIELAPTSAAIVDIESKIDVVPPRRPGTYAVSATTGSGLETLHQKLVSLAQSLTHSDGPPPLTRIRHRSALTEMLTCLDAAATLPLPELRAEELRLGLRAIGRITGAVGVEDILDSLFHQFCIGK